MGDARTMPRVRDDDWHGLRRALNTLSKLSMGPESSPVFGGLTLTAPLVVTSGGTGAATLTDHGILLGSGTGAITPLGVATNGQLPIGSTGADPALAALTGTANRVTVTNGAGTITLSGPQDIHIGASPTFNNMTLDGDLSEISGTATIKRLLTGGVSAP